MKNHERMSSIDTSWLRMDRPHNLMMIVGIMMFDGPLDFDRLKSVLATPLLKESETSDPKTVARRFLKSRKLI